MWRLKYGKGTVETLELHLRGIFVLVVESTLIVQ